MFLKASAMQVIVTDVILVRSVRLSHSCSLIEPCTERAAIWRRNLCGLQ